MHQEDTIRKLGVDYWRQHRYASFTWRVVTVGGGDPALAAMTLQKGEAPKVTASVEGGGAETGIGARVVAFDGKRLNLAGKRPSSPGERASRRNGPGRAAA